VDWKKRGKKAGSIARQDRATRKSSKVQAQVIVDAKRMKTAVNNTSPGRRLEKGQEMKLSRLRSRLAGRTKDRELSPFRNEPQWWIHRATKRQKRGVLVGKTGVLSKALECR
jgi:hypothetical protein